MTRSTLIALLLHVVGIAAGCALSGSRAQSARAEARWIALEPGAQPLPPTPRAPEPMPIAESAPDPATVLVEPQLEDGFEPAPASEPRPFRELPQTDAWLARTPIVDPKRSGRPTEEDPSTVEPAAVPPSTTEVSAVVEPTPRTSVNLPPTYPFPEWRRGHQGTVVLDLDIDVRGFVTGVHLVSTSGHAGLDAAARSRLLTWQFEPALREGHACATVLRQSVEFRIVP